MFGLVLSRIFAKVIGTVVIILGFLRRRNFVVRTLDA